MPRTEVALGIEREMDRIQEIEKKPLETNGEWNSTVDKYLERATKLLLSLFTEEGLPASKDRRFHHYFGRDTFISAHFIHDAHQNAPNTKLWNMAKNAVFSFWKFQRPSGQLPHEVKRFDENDPLLLTGHFYRDDEWLVNDDSVDATPLGLIVTPFFVDRDSDEFNELCPKAIEALEWIMKNMDENSGWLSYRYNALHQQGWMDSKFSVINDDGTLPEDPIALVEVQGFAWKALRLWSDLLMDTYPGLSQELLQRADDLKARFNERFLMEDEKGIFFIQALDGKGNQIRSTSINPGLCLWAAYKQESIIDARCIPAVIDRLMSPGFFDEDSGISTFEEGQKSFDPDGGYHRPSSEEERVKWPIASAMVEKGMINFDAERQAKRSMLGNMNFIHYFGSFVETGNKNGKLSLFDRGDARSTKDQTWNAAAYRWEATNPLLRRN